MIRTPFYRFEGGRNYTPYNLFVLRTQLEPWVKRKLGAKIGIRFTGIPIDEKTYQRIEFISIDKTIKMNKEMIAAAQEEINNIIEESGVYCLLIPYEYKEFPYRWMYDMIPLLHIGKRGRRGLEVDLTGVTNFDEYYADLLRNTLENLRMLKERGIVYDPPSFLIENWGLIPADSSGYYHPSWDDRRIIHHYDNMLNFIRRRESEDWVDLSIPDNLVNRHYIASRLQGEDIVFLPPRKLRVFVDSIETIEKILGEVDLALSNSVGSCAVVRIGYNLPENVPTLVYKEEDRYVLSFLSKESEPIDIYYQIRKGTPSPTPLLEWKTETIEYYPTDLAFKEKVDPDLLRALLERDFQTKITGFEKVRRDGYTIYYPYWEDDPIWTEVDALLRFKQRYDWDLLADLFFVSTSSLTPYAIAHLGDVNKIRSYQGVYLTNDPEIIEPIREYIARFEDDGYFVPRKSFALSKEIARLWEGEVVSETYRIIKNGIPLSISPEIWYDESIELIMSDLLPVYEVDIGVTEANPAYHYFVYRSYADLAKRNQILVPYITGLFVGKDGTITTPFTSWEDVKMFREILEEYLASEREISFVEIPGALRFEEMARYRYSVGSVSSVGASLIIRIENKYFLLFEGVSFSLLEDAELRDILVKEIELVCGSVNRGMSIRELLSTIPVNGICVTQRQPPGWELAGYFDFLSLSGLLPSLRRKKISPTWGAIYISPPGYVLLTTMGENLYIESEDTMTMIGFAPLHMADQLNERWKKGDLSPDWNNAIFDTTGKWSRKIAFGRLRLEEEPSRFLLTL